MSKNVLKQSNDRNIAQKRSTLAVKLLRHLYKNVSGKEISLNHRKENNSTKDLSLTYGEINVESFLQILALTQSSFNSKERIFVDLGCGTGRAVLCAALSPYQFTKVWGIEIIPTLTDEAVLIHEQLVDIMSGKSAVNLAVSESISKPVIKSSKDKDIAQIIPALIQAYQVTQAMINSRLKLSVESDDEVFEMEVETLANETIKAVGHKQYKAHVKTHRTFLRYLKNLPDIYTLSEDNARVTLTVALGKSTPENSDTTTESVNEQKDINVGDNDAEAPLLVSLDGLSLLDTTTTPSAATGDGADIMQAESDSATSSTTKNSGVNRVVPLNISPQDLLVFAPLPEILYTTGSIFDPEHNWWDRADVAYAASLLFSHEMMVELTHKAALMKSGSYVVTLKPLVVDLNVDYKERVVLISESFFKMSWQMAKVYIYRLH